MPAPTATDETTAPRAPSRRRWIVIAVLVAIAMLAVVLLWFQPQTLLFDTVVEDDFPTAALPGEPADGDSADEADREEADASTVVEDEDGELTASADTEEAVDEPAVDTSDEPAPDTSAQPAPDTSAVEDQPVALGTGTFGSRNRYTVTGAATAYQLAGSERILRLEGFESTNGPDLFVYLTVGDASDPSDAALAAEFVDLGVLRGNVGDQNYVIPAEVDLARFDTVVIFCRRFGTAFGAADLD